MKQQNTTTMKPQEIFEGIPTSQLIGYKSMGDNSKELMQEITRRLSLINRTSKNITEIDSKNNGEKIRVL